MAFLFLKLARYNQISINTLSRNSDNFMSNKKSWTSETKGRQSKLVEAYCLAGFDGVGLL